MKKYVERVVARLLARLFIISFLVVALPASALEPRELFRQTEPSVVVVLASDARGANNVQTSGVLIAALDVLTSCKGVADGADIVVAQGGALRPATVRHADLERDLCQLRLREPLPAARIAQSDMNAQGPQIGDDVYLVSAPRGLDRTFSRFMLSGLREVPGTGARLLQMDGSPEAGSFGGGVFDQNGNLVGVLTPQFRQSDTVSFAMPLAWAAELATRAPERARDVASQATGPAPAAGSATQDARWHPGKGERWRYRLMDGRRNVGTVTIEIVEAGGGRVRELITRSDSPGFSVEREVRADFSTATFQPSVQLPGGYQLIELSPYFPPGSSFSPRTAVGKLPGDINIPSVGLTRVTWETRVLGLERVRVPAGEFEAWKVEAVAAFDTRFGPTKATYTVWYSKSMARPVKLALKSKVPGHAMGFVTEYLDLAAFEPPK